LKGLNGLRGSQRAGRREGACGGEESETQRKSDIAVGEKVTFMKEGVKKGNF